MCSLIFNFTAYIIFVCVFCVCNNFKRKHNFCKSKCKNSLCIHLHLGILRNNSHNHSFISTVKSFYKEMENLWVLFLLRGKQTLCKASLMADAGSKVTLFPLVQKHWSEHQAYAVVWHQWTMVVSVGWS